MFRLFINHIEKIKLQEVHHMKCEIPKCKPNQKTKLTCNELLIFNDRHIGLQAGEAEEFPPGDADLMDIGALPVVQAPPRGKHQYPVISLLPQSLHKGCHADIHISSEVKTLWRIHIIQQVPEMPRENILGLKKLRLEKCNCRKATLLGFKMLKFWEYLHNESKVVTIFLHHYILQW